MPCTLRCSDQPCTWRHHHNACPRSKDRGYSGEQKHLTELMRQGILHKDFSFLDVFSPCVTYNHDDTYQWFRPRVKKLEDDSSYDSSDWTAAIEQSLLWGEEIPKGHSSSAPMFPPCTKLSRS